jgi:biopolymer transport protein ExbD
MKKRGFSKYMDKRSPSTFKIQITSMVDMFVILLVFLLKSYSTSAVQIAPGNDLTLPASTSVKDPVDVLKLVVTKAGVFVEDEKVLALANGAIPAAELEANDPMFIRSLYEALDKQAKKTLNIASRNDALEFDGKVLMQADRGLPYSLLRKVMYTSMLAGYADVKIAVLSSAN